MDAPHGLPPLSEAQLEIMNVVWDHGEADGRRCVEALSWKIGKLLETRF